MKSYISSKQFYLYIACDEIDAVCACVPRKVGKFKAPPSNDWIVDRMYVNFPGQYNVLMKIKPQPFKYKCYYNEELGVMMPPISNDSEDSYYTKKSLNIHYPQLMKIMMFFMMTMMFRDCLMIVVVQSSIIVPKMWTKLIQL